jgi:hypothetical protein
MNWGTIMKAIYDWAISQARLKSGIPTYDFMWEDQSEHRLSPPYGSLKISSGPVRIFQDELRKNGGNFLNSGLREITLQVNLYGEKALEVSDFLSGGIERPTVLEMFQSAGLAYVSASAVRNLTRLTGPRYESRFQFDVRFRLAHNFVDVGQGYFDKVEFTNGLNDKTELIDP